MATYNAPHSTVAVEVPDALVERYEAAGFVKVAKRAPRKAAEKKPEKD